MTSLDILEERINDTHEQLQKCIETGQILEEKAENERLPQFQRIIEDVSAMKEEAYKEIESYQKVIAQLENEETLNRLQLDVIEVTNARKALEIFTNWLLKRKQNR